MRIRLEFVILGKPLRTKNEERANTEMASTLNEKRYSTSFSIRLKEEKRRTNTNKLCVPFPGGLR